jgi:CMP/dCMP kinase
MFLWVIISFIDNCCPEQGKHESAVLNTSVPILTIDGPTGVGKGTVSQLMAKTLGWHYLDSGIHYRLMAWIAVQYGYGQADVATLLAKFETVLIEINFDSEQKAMHVALDGQDVTQQLRSEACGTMASELSSIPQIRQALLLKQRRFAQAPGLVTDGRDMGSVVFPDATYKVYLDATESERAKRRYNQLKQKGIDVNLSDVSADLRARDQRDQTRVLAPLQVAQGAYVVDTTHRTVNQVCEAIMAYMAAE